MGEVLIKLVNMSVTASWLVLAVVVLRLILKKAPRRLSCLLWGLVGLRLVLPFSVESVLSLIPSTQTITPTTAVGRPFEITLGVPAIDQTVGEYLGSHYYEGVTVPTNTFWNATAVATVIWLCGVVLMLSYSVLSYWRLRHTVNVSLRERENIYLCDAIDSPFILGVVCPRIYLPSGLSPEQTHYVIAHEQAHLKRLDHWWKLLGFVLLSVYWFNPVLWLAYVLFCRDIEAACDEKVIATMDAEAKKGYSEALVACSVHRRKVIVCSLAFREVGVKSRIRSILHYKKPTVWILTASVALCAVAAVCLLTDPKQEASSDTVPIATVEDAKGYLEENADGRTLYFSRGLTDTAFPITSEFLDILRFDEWEETDVDVQSETYGKQRVFIHSFGKKGDYSLKFYVGKVYGAVEWYGTETVEYNGFFSMDEVYKGGVYYTLPQTYEGDMIYNLMQYEARSRGEDYPGERLEDEERRIVDTTADYTVLLNKRDGQYYWRPSGKETLFGPYAVQPTVTEERGFLKVESERTDWYEIDSGWYWQESDGVSIERLYEKRGDKLLYYASGYVGVYDLAAARTLANVPFVAEQDGFERGRSYAKFRNDTTVKVVYYVDVGNGTATRKFEFTVEDTAKSDPSVDPPETALAICDKVVITPTSYEPHVPLVITAADAHSLRFQSEDGARVVTLSESNIVRLNAMYASVKDFSANDNLSFSDATEITVFHNGETSVFPSGGAAQRELDRFVSELARFGGWVI